ARDAKLWVTTDGLPTNDSNSPDDGRQRPLSADHNLGMAHPQGTSLRSTDLAPGAVTPMVLDNDAFSRLTDLPPPCLPFLTLSTSASAPHSLPRVPRGCRPAAPGPRAAVAGEAILLMDDGSETHLKNPGDTVIQRGAMHA
ncbi:hypothetical protein HDZ31DRAFT_18872, partial [Schizophyllum fasciatum]